MGTHHGAGGSKVSDTPETDAEKFFSDHYGYYVVLAEHAEDLERERDKYQEQADEILIQLGATQERMIDAVRERDEARFDLAFRRELYAVQELQLAEARKTIAELRHKTL